MNTEDLRSAQKYRVIRDGKEFEIKEAKWENYKVSGPSLFSSNEGIEYGIVEFLLKEPFYAHLMSRIEWRPTRVMKGIDPDGKEIEIPECPTAGVKYTGSSRTPFHIVYNPEFIKNLDKKHKFGVILHELHHIIRGHVTSRASLMRENPRMGNMAFDLEINDEIREFLPRNCSIPGVGSFKEFPVGRAAEYYFQLLKEIGDSASSLQDDSDFVDDHEGWNQSEKSNGRESDRENNISDNIKKEQVKEYVRRLLKEAKTEADKSNSWGSVSAAMRELIDKFVNPKVPWEDQFKQILRKSLKSKRRSSVRKINKRTPYLFPGYKRGKKPYVGIAVDQSGSVSDDLLAKFFSEMINLSKTCQFVYIPFDHDVFIDKVQIVSSRKPFETYRELCGGTNFNSPTEYINERARELDALFILTDMEAPTPMPCRVQRIWITDERGANYANSVNFNFQGEPLIVID